MPLSVLDLSPVPTGSRPSQALHETLELARTAEAAGYHRYWLAEHHNIPSVVSTSPEVMIAAVAAATSSIRVGSGGIMLPNHSPLKVAETFRVLAGLYPDRIDLGIGRAPGTDQRTALALRRSRETLGADDFPEQYAELRAYAEGFPGGHPFAPISAQPDDVPLPPVWILGSSTYGGQAAAALGTGFAYAGHFGTLDPAGVIASYREKFQPSDHQTRAARDPRAGRDRVRHRGARPATGPRQRPLHAPPPLRPPGPAPVPRGSRVLPLVRSRTRRRRRMGRPGLRRHPRPGSRRPLSTEPTPPAPTS